MDILIELHYLPCIQYFSKFDSYSHVVIDDTEAFEKQSYRNRASIAGANGRMDIIVPVHGSRRQQPVKEVQIDNHAHWQHSHWQSIRSAYGKTAFFEHYAHLLFPLYETPYQYLFDFDMGLLAALLRITKTDPAKLLLKSEAHINEADILDFRNHIHPKPRFAAEDPMFMPPKYFQAFETKNGFLPNLSVIDLVFNDG